jgi:hypothetical protein
MRRIVFALVPAVVLPAIAAVAIAATPPMTTVSTRVYVSPGSGGQHTKFKLRFRIPNATGMPGLLRRADLLSVSGPSRKGCISGTSVTLGSPRPAGARLRVTLNPSGLGGDWCVGTFRGRLIETQQVICPPPTRACPDFAVAPRTIAQFKFRVQRPRSG